MIRQTLKGKRIVLTRSTETRDEWGTYLKLRGAIVYKFSTIETSLVSPTKKIADILSRLNTFSWIVFTSPQGPYAMRDLMKKLHIKIQPKEMSSIAVIGEKTRGAVRDIGCHVAFTPSVSESKVLAHELTSKFKSLRSPILLLRADIASKELPKTLKARGVRVMDIPIYKTKIIRTKPTPHFLKLLEGEKIDYVVFASPSAVEGFFARIKGKAMKNIVCKIPAVALSARIALALRKAGFHNIHVAKNTTVQGITDAMLDF